jgi:hypothetical protein
MVYPRDQCLDQCSFSFYINDLPKAVNNHSKPVLFAANTSVVSNPNLVNFNSDLIFSFEQLNTWFNTNLLSLNYNRMQYMQFRPNSLATEVDISYNNKYIVIDTNTKFLGITVDSSLSWKNCIDGLMVKLSKACYAIRSLRYFVS